MRKSEVFSYKLYLFLVAILLFFVFVYAVEWVGYPWQNPFYVDEDGLPSININLSQNVSSLPSETPLSYRYGSDTDISSSEYGEQDPSFFYWITLDSVGGIFTINSTKDNETGQFNVSLDVYNNNEESAGAKIFKFTINATNDEPSFLLIENNYSYPTNGSAPTYYVSLSDEEEHYPLNFSLVFFDNCTHAEWLGIPDGTECSLFDIVNDTSSSAHFDYGPFQDDVGSYWAQLTITEAPHDCPHIYCDNDTYEVPHVLVRNISFEVFSFLEVNVSDCANRIFTEGVAENCTIEVRTQSSDDDFNISSIASFTNSSNTPNNESWFFNSSQMQATNFFYEFNVTVNASHSLVGYWDINFSVERELTNEFDWDNFSIFVNMTANNEPVLFDFANNYNVSVSNSVTIPFNVSDYDFIIEDKDFWDEDSTIDVSVTNLSSGLEITSLNYTLKKGTVSSTLLPINITFNTESDQAGIYEITLNVTDIGGSVKNDTFNLTVIENSFPYWNQSLYFLNFTVNSTYETTTDSLTNINLNRTYANDSDIDDVLTFTKSGSYPPSLSLTSQGMLNFHPWKGDVGYWDFYITATDDLGLYNTSHWIFNVSNINTPPWIDNTSFIVNSRNIYLDNFNAEINQGEMSTFVINLIYDNDLLISSSQVANGYYDEVLVVTEDITNTSFVYTPIDFDFSMTNAANNHTKFETSFTPLSNNTGNYTVDLLVTDASGENDTLSFNLTIVAVNSAPDIDDIDDIETTIMNRSFFYNVIATDEEDNRDGYPLNYSILSLTVGAPSLTINSTNGTIFFDFNNNQAYSGFWQYRVFVNDSDSGSSTVDFNLTVFGLPDISLPSTDDVFSLSENITIPLNFTVNYTINSTNLSYYVYLDNITCVWINKDLSLQSCNYTDLSLIDNGFFIYNNATNFSFNLSLGFYDETYGNNKNLSLLIYNPNYPLLNDTTGYSMTVGHVNSPLVFWLPIPFNEYEGDKGGDIVDVDLSNYFYDVDYFDAIYEQNVNFSLNISTNSGLQRPLLSESFENWTLQLISSLAGTANISVIGYEWDSDSLIRSVNSNWFNVTFEEPESTQNVNTPRSGSSSTRTKTLLEHYSLKIIAPGDLEIEPNNFVVLNFSLINDGDVDLYGIDLSSFIDLGGLMSKDITVTLSEDYVESLAVNEKKDYSLRAHINTEAFGDYRITIFGNVTTPELSDWAEFYIKVLSFEEGELTELLVFTEKLVSENPECLELRELYNEAYASYERGDLTEARELANQAISACEDAITANEQIRFFDQKMSLSLFYSLVITLFLFLAGFIYYFYRRIKFKKFVAKEYM